MSARPDPFSKSAAAREEILASIRKHLADSARIAGPVEPVSTSKTENSSITARRAQRNGNETAARSLVEIFRMQLGSVGAHCVLIPQEAELILAVQSILAELQTAGTPNRRIALSDAQLLRNLTDKLDAGAYEVAVVPTTNDLFTFDIGITMAQAAIAETGTLVLESGREKHRFISLLPPVHIAIVDAKDIWATLGDAITKLQAGPEISPAITFITGPSRTADIELTLSIGVHGPKELYVIVKGGTEFNPN